jgi:hypothetical protein
MRQRLLDVRKERKASPLTKSAKSFEFDPAGFEDLAWWVQQGRNKSLRFLKMIKCNFDLSPLVLWSLAISRAV